tara:strand:+ start:235 stop:822 length:588 start_codon:yes stop_codon:yes gene_type:complete
LRKTSEIIGLPPKTRLGHAVGCEVKGCQSYGHKTPAGYIYSKCVTHRILNGEKSSRLGKTLCKATKKAGGKCRARAIDGTDFCQMHHWESTGLKNEIYVDMPKNKAKIVEYPEDHPLAKNVNENPEEIPDFILKETDIEKLRAICLVVFEEYPQHWSDIVSIAKRKIENKEKNSMIMSKINVLQLEINKLREELK